MAQPRKLFQGEYMGCPDQFKDDRFGRWVRQRRITMDDKSYWECASDSGIERSRWLAIERGAVKRGVTKKECLGIATALCVEPEKVFKLAAGEE